MSAASASVAERARFLFTVDTEEEWNWHGPFPRPPFSTRNFERLVDLQRHCESWCLRPTYLVDFAVLDVKAHVKRLRHWFESGQCDLGAHLHPWCTPPVHEPVDRYHSWAVHLEPELFEAKLATLTGRFVDAFGVHPISFRSGRWAMNGSMLATLARHGYRVDTSVYPFHVDDGIDYRHATTRPYRPAFHDMHAHDPDQRSIVEVPVSSGFTWSNFERCDRLMRQLARPVLRPARLVGLVGALRGPMRAAVTPEAQRDSAVLRCINHCIVRRHGVINLFMHSSDLLPGATPYTASDDDVERLYASLKRYVDYARNIHDTEFVTIRESLGAFDAIADGSS